MKNLIERYRGKTIGINLTKPHHVEPATVVGAEENYFSVKADGSDDLYHLPYLNIVKAIENADGITVKEFLHRGQTYMLVIKIGHLVEYVPM